MLNIYFWKGTFNNSLWIVWWISTAQKHKFLLSWKSSCLLSVMDDGLGTQHGESFDLKYGSNSLKMALTAIKLVVFLSLVCYVCLLHWYLHNCGTFYWLFLVWGAHIHFQCVVTWYKKKLKVYFSISVFVHSCDVMII